MKNGDKTIELKAPGATGAFANVLAGMKRGDVLGDLDNALKEIVTAVHLTGKPGVLTLKLKISPDGKANTESDLYKIEDDITVKKPRKSRGVSRFFGDDDGNLLRNDPKQMEIHLTEVPAPAEAPQAAANGASATKAQAAS